MRKSINVDDNIRMLPVIKKDNTLINVFTKEIFQKESKIVIVGRAS